MSSYFPTVSQAECDLFINSLNRRSDDRGVMAALERAAADEPWKEVSIFPYVVSHIPDERDTWRNRCFFIVAALFGVHPKHSHGMGNFGVTCRIISSRVNTETTSDRFQLLLDLDKDEIFEHLYGWLSMADSKNVSVDYAILLRDLVNWENEQNTQRQWATQFYEAPVETE